MRGAALAAVVVDEAWDVPGESCSAVPQRRGVTLFPHEHGKNKPARPRWNLATAEVLDAEATIAMAMEHQGRYLALLRQFRVHFPPLG